MYRGSEGAFGAAGVLTADAWRTVTLEAQVSPLHYLSRIEGQGVTVDDRARSMALRLEPRSEELTLKVVVRRPADLGFEDDALKKTTFGDIRRKATEEYKLDLCPPELALALRLVWTDQSKYDWMIVASPRIRMEEPLGGFGLFRLDRDWKGRPSLEWVNGNDDCRFPNHAKFLFVLS